MRVHSRLCNLYVRARALVYVCFYLRLVSCAQWFTEVSLTYVGDDAFVETL